MKQFFQKKKPFGPGLDTDFKAMVMETVETWWRWKSGSKEQNSSLITLLPPHVKSTRHGCLKRGLALSFSKWCGNNWALMYKGIWI